MENNNAIGQQLSKWLIIKNIMMAMTVMVSFLIAGQAHAGGHYKLKINNTMYDTLKVKWYCDGKKKDADTYPAFNSKTRQLSKSKCPDINDLTIKIYSGTYAFKVAMNGYFDSDSYANVTHVDLSDLDKTIMKSSLLTEIKFSKIDTSSSSGDKRCVAVAPDSFWAAIFGPGSLVTPAFYPKKC